MFWTICPNDPYAGATPETPSVSNLVGPIGKALAEAVSKGVAWPHDVTFVLTLVFLKVSDPPAVDVSQLFNVYLTSTNLPQTMF